MYILTVFIESHIIVIRDIEVGGRLAWGYCGPARRVGGGGRRLQDAIVDELSPGQRLAARHRSREKASKQSRRHV